MLTSLFKVDRLKPIRSLSRLKVLYMAHNFVRDWREFEHLVELPCLEDLVTNYLWDVHKLRNTIRGGKWVAFVKSVETQNLTTWLLIMNNRVFHRNSKLSPCERSE